jgi:hypothetical protein
MSSFTEKGDIGSLRAGPQGGVPDRSDIPLNNNWDECADTVHGSLRGGGRNGLNSDFSKGRGAGRVLDVSWPMPGTLFGSTSGSGESYTRQGFHQSLLVGVGQSPGFSAVEYYKGRVAVKYVAGSGRAYQGGPIFHPVQEANGPEVETDAFCWRVKAILAFNPLLGAGDTGLWFVRAGDDSAFMLGTSRGFAIRPVSATTVQLLSRTAIGVGFQMSDELDIVIDVSEYNVYEARFIGGSEAVPPQVKVYINGVLVNTYGYDFLPTGPMVPYVGSGGGGTNWLAIGGLNMAAARDEASLL